MRFRTIAAWMGGVGVVAATAAGQSINIRFGSPSTIPSSAYGAAGAAGVWNSFQYTSEYSHQSLVNLLGQPIAATYYQAGSASILSYNNPLTVGDDERLMDNMFISTNSPTDGCFWVDGLTHGSYEVTIYAMTPNDSLLMSRTRVDNGSPGPVMVGGTWPGSHQLGVTYSRFTVTTTDGVIAFHDGLAGANIQSGMNGVQLRFLGCTAPTVAVQPSSLRVCPTGTGQFSITATGSGLFYQWQVQTSPGVWQTMANDPGPLPCGGGAFAYAAPVNSPAVTIGIHGCPGDRTVPQHFQVRCVVTNSCGSATSDPATYTICPVDINCSGSTDVGDIFAFLPLWFSGNPAADWVPDSLNQINDIFRFIASWFAGCP